MAVGGWMVREAGRRNKDERRPRYTRARCASPEQRAHLLFKEINFLLHLLQLRVDFVEVAEEHVERNPCGLVDICNVGAPIVPGREGEREGGRT
jgi:hypothetical protein